MSNLIRQRTQAQKDFGLRTDRPFRFCKMRWGYDDYSCTKPGDDPNASNMRVIEWFLPEIEHTTNIEPHDHEFYEIALIGGGDALHESDSGVCKIQRGDVLVIPPPAVHAYRAIHGLIKTNIFIQPTWFFEDLRVLWSEQGLVRFILADALFMRTLPATLLHLHTNEEETVFWEKEVDDLISEAKKRKPSLALFNGCLLKILSVINGAFMRQESSVSHLLKPEIWSAIEKIENCVRQSIPLDIEALACDARMPVYSFCLAFKSATGRPPRDYYRFRRIENAKRLLMEPEKSITDVAYTLGFADGPHFSRVFKAETGFTPREFKNELKATTEDTLYPIA